MLSGGEQLSQGGGAVIINNGYVIQGLCKTGVYRVGVSGWSRVAGTVINGSELYVLLAGFT